ncbi:MAG TPA: YidC/Oxa1 family membrane protein insertase [Acidimicrobiales bacterium]|nr:YidC/Oxa1 family membrane protein insertase [Acidimicrobiales bacterium]
MLDSLFEGISTLLNFFYTLVPNYAVAIALLTCVVMLVTTPLTLKGTRSMIEMQRLQPEIRKLQVQYKDDRQKLNEEMMAFYKEHEINPVGGCLPLLIQAPVFSILFYVVRGLTNPYRFTGLQDALADHGVDISGLRENFASNGFRPKYLDHSTDLYQSLLGQDHMNAFGIDLARSASTALSAGFVEALPYFGLVAVIALLSWFQQKQIMGRNPNAEMSQQQRTMMILGPVLYVFFAFVSPAAIGVYFLVSTSWRVAQQYYITRSLYGHEEAAGVQAQRAMAELRESRKKDGDGGGGGLLGGLLGGGQGGTTSNGRSGKASRSATKSGDKTTPRARNGSTSSGRAKPASPATSKAAATKGSGGRTGGGATGGNAAANKPHPRSRKKKKRK